MISAVHYRALVVLFVAASWLSAPADAWCQHRQETGGQPVDLSEVAAAHRARAFHPAAHRAPAISSLVSTFESITLNEDSSDDNLALAASCFPRNRTAPHWNKVANAEKRRMMCRQSARQLVKRYRSLGNNSCSLLDPDYLGMPGNDAARIDVSSYSRDCLRSWKHDKTANMTPGIRAIISASVGVISLPADSTPNCFHGRNTCVGILLKNKVLTARHCISDRDPDSPLWIVAEQVDMDFTAINGEHYKLYLDGELQSDAASRLLDFSEQQPDRDWIVLNATPGRGHLPKKAIGLRRDLAVPGRQILMVSYNPYIRAAMLAQLHTEQTEIPEIVQEALTVEQDPTCSVLQTDGHVIFHACQTERTMSGTPLLTIDGDSVALIGIHNGNSTRLVERLFPAELDKRSKCKGFLEQLYPNYGIMLPDGIEKYLSAR